MIHRNIYISQNKLSKKKKDLKSTERNLITESIWITETT